MTEKTPQQQFENQLKQIEHRLLEEYLRKKRPIRLLPKLVAELTEGEREKFFKLFPKGIQERSLPDALALVERTLAKRGGIE